MAVYTDCPCDFALTLINFAHNRLYRLETASQPSQPYHIAYPDRTLWRGDDFESIGRIGFR